MTDTITSVKQIVLRGDRAYLCETFEQDIGNIDRVIQDSLTKSANITFMPQPLLPMMRKWTKQHFIATTKKNTTFVFTEVEYVPLKGALVEPADGRIHFTQTNTSVQELISEGYTPVPKERWTPPEEFKLFYMQTIEATGKLGLMAYTFVVYMGKPYILPLPNQYSDTRVCAGKTYEDIPYGSNEAPMMQVKKGLDTLHEAPPNKDLTGRSTFRLLKWQKNEETGLLEESKMVSVPDFLSTVTYEPIIHFTNFYNERNQSNNS